MYYSFDENFPLGSDIECREPSPYFLVTNQFWKISQCYLLSKSCFKRKVLKIGCFGEPVCWVPPKRTSNPDCSAVLCGHCLYL